ncbi:gluconate 2-dehydrogenase subunit 3 family protein [Panacibacter sp. DH6]|uniref:Gluconate 2-dehydrogenase subunit 3 family protein n=1 Tax=Panacibacter microcysteis TaxID=2793269 RepID=A0A931E9I2_9BACT|nr:gluconate 2-dehydrogenase subunit 3 family protein [Panacibacter microcysteis]MBG9376171.1 gluconate 2-dehydrogenase subunit 3 family protein [Panacibacter microcysteis]
MNRRNAFKQILLVTAGAALIPSCMDDKNKSAVILKNFSISAEQEALLAELAETIIPKTDTPGARDISAHLFLLKMMDDCNSREKQNEFVKGMEAFETLADKQTGKKFANATLAERVQLLTLLEAQQKDQKSGDAASFYATVKRYTIQAYTSSQFFLTKVKVYELIPGRFHGCVPVKA